MAQTEFKEGDKFQINFGTSKREATVVKVNTVKVTVSIDLGGRHPLLSSFSHESFAKKVEEGTEVY